MMGREEGSMVEGAEAEEGEEGVGEEEVLGEAVEGFCELEMRDCPVESFLLSEIIGCAGGLILG